MNNNEQVDMDNLELASMSSRIKSFIIDDILITCVLVLMFWEQIEVNNGNFAAIMNILNVNLLPVIVVKLIYQWFFIWYYGATLGKMAAKIKVVDYYNFGRISPFNALLRSFGRIISEMFFYVGFIVAFFNDGRQTFHDRIGKTLVVNA